MRFFFFVCARVCVVCVLELELNDCCGIGRREDELLWLRVCRQALWVTASFICGHHLLYGIMMRLDV